MKTFWLGTHCPNWLEDERFRDVPLFISMRTLMTRTSLPRACGRWAADGGGFTEIQLHGKWTFTPANHVDYVRKFRDQIGGLAWAAPQDWMCEPAVIGGLVEKRKPKACVICAAHGRRVLGKPPVLRTVALDDGERATFICDVCGIGNVDRGPRIHVGEWRSWAEQAGDVMAPALADASKYGLDAVVVFHGTGLSVAEHQRRTVENFLELRRLDAELPIIPVLQGWTLGDYWRCEGLYRDAGVDLRKEPVVGVGSVCRRQGTGAASRIMMTLASSGIRIHGFGFKTQGLQGCHHVLESADSLAWSYAARRDPPLPGHDKPGPGRRTGHINCANCADYALAWRTALLASLHERARPPIQHDLFDAAP